MGKIDFLNADVAFRFNHQKKVKCLITLILNEEISANVEKINIIFCSDKFLLKINRKFLHHNFFTDIITFNYSETDNSIEGELYISIDRIKENADKLHKTFNNELSRVIIHGVLHLCGYNDKRKEEKDQMREMEDRYLQSI